MKELLIGRWKTLQSDYVSRLEYGETEIEFKPNGKLVYNVIDGNKVQKIFMRYEIQGNKLLTIQKSSNDQTLVETGFEFVNGLLVLEYEGFKSAYCKQPKRWYEKIFKTK